MKTSVEKYSRILAWMLSGVMVCTSIPVGTLSASAEENVQEAFGADDVQVQDEEISDPVEEAEEPFISAETKPEEKAEELLISTDTEPEEAVETKTGDGEEICFELSAYESSDITDLITVENGIITKYTGTDIAVIEIPGEVDGVTVTGIGEKAFYSHSEITAVTFPNTIERIDGQAFEGTSLGTDTQTGSITLPGSLKSMGPSAFAGCAYLGEVTFTDVETPLQEGIGFGEIIGGGYQFDSCPHLTKITLSNNIVTIPAKFAQKSGRSIRSSGERTWKR